MPCPQSGENSGNIDARDKSSSYVSVVDPVQRDLFAEWAVGGE